MPTRTGKPASNAQGCVLAGCGRLGRPRPNLRGAVEDAQSTHGQFAIWGQAFLVGVPITIAYDPLFGTFLFAAEVVLAKNQPRSLAHFVRVILIVRGFASPKIVNRPLMGDSPTISAPVGSNNGDRNCNSEQGPGRKHARCKHAKIALYGRSVAQLAADLRTEGIHCGQFDIYCWEYCRSEIRVARDLPTHFDSLFG